MGPAPLGGSCEEERFPHTRNPLHGQRLQVAEGGGASEPWRGTQQQVCRAQSRDIPAQRNCADQHSPAREACLLTHWDGRVLGAEAQVSVRSQGEDWCWLHEHSRKGLVHHSWPGGSLGKSLDLPKRQETFSSLFVSWCMRRGD